VRTSWSSQSDLTVFVDQAFGALGWQTLRLRLHTYRDIWLQQHLTVLNRSGASFIGRQPVPRGGSLWLQAALGAQAASLCCCIV